MITKFENNFCKRSLAASLIVLLACAAFVKAEGEQTITPDPCDPNATSRIDETGRLVDKIDYLFFDDPEVIGSWRTVDLVRKIEDFQPQRKSWKGQLWLNFLIFDANGLIAGSGFLTWTKGLLINPNERTASAYTIKEIDGSTYMFFEWKSGDYAIRHRPPSYYVLKKVPIESIGQIEPMFGKPLEIPPTSTIDANGVLIDKIDYPFENDPCAIGVWKSVDFVDEPNQFQPSNPRWRGGLYLDKMVIFKYGRTAGPWSWTKGLILHPGDRTASKYLIREIEGSRYMFFEWKSGDYSFSYMKPKYYVLKKVPDEAIGETEPMFGKPLDEIPPTSKIDANGVLIDKIDYPFENDPCAIGVWKSVDFVDEPNQFQPGNPRWKGDLFFKGAKFYPNGRIKEPFTWTKGLILDSADRAASKYLIREIEGTRYMLFEWKTDDYSFGHMKPKYVVMKYEGPVAPETSEQTPQQVK